MLHNWIILRLSWMKDQVLSEWSEFINPAFSWSLNRFLHIIMYLCSCFQKVMDRWHKTASWVLSSSRSWSSSPQLNWSSSPWISHDRPPFWGRDSMVGVNYVLLQALLFVCLSLQTVTQHLMNHNVFSVINDCSVHARIPRTEFCRKCSSGTC